MVTYLSQFIKAHWKKLTLAVLAVGLAIVALWRGCSKPIPPNSPLGPDEIARVVVDGRKVTITTAKGTTEKFVPDTAKVTVRTDGAVDVKVQSFGIKAEFGGGFVVTPSRLKLALDTRILYFQRFSLHGGLSLDPTASQPTEYIRPLLFVAYPLPFKMTPNTSAFIGAEFPIWVGQTTVPVGGLRVRF